jgi:ubiquinone/menaquinone biosynthesis C-methylase UbiE
MGQVLTTGDYYKDEIQRQWDRDACGSHYAKETLPNTLEWYLEIERHRYGVYAPWMPEVMEFDRHRGEKLLEVGAGLGTDHAQFARNGALTTDLDLSSGHLEHAKRNFSLRGLDGEFVHGDAENMPFHDETFDVVYSNGVIHHSPNTQRIVDEMYRVLRPGGRIIVMVYAENSLHYWRNLFYKIGIEQGRLARNSMGQIMSENVELSEHGSKPLVKVYTRRRLDAFFARFVRRQILQRQMVPEERPRLLRKVPVGLLERLLGWNLIIKAYKPARG